MLSKKKILITGVCGMMGNAAATYLRDNYGDTLEIYGVDDLSGSYAENIPTGIHFTKIDLRDAAAVKCYFDLNLPGKLDYLMSYAAAAHEIRSFFTPIDNMSRNLDLFRNVTTYALEHHVDHISFFSSMSRYGEGKVKNGNDTVVLEQSVPFNESHIPAPEDPYAVSKVACEQMLKAFQNVYDFTYTIWVPHNCFSPMQYVEPYRNFLAIWMNLLLLGKSPVIYGDGLQQRAISWVDDFNPVVCKALFNHKTYNETINIGGDDHRSINDWFSLVKQVSGLDIDAVHMEKRPGEVKYAYCSHEKAARLAGFKNNTDIEQAIYEMWKYFLKKGPRPFKYLDEFEINSPKIPTTWRKRLF